MACSIFRSTYIKVSAIFLFLAIGLYVYSNSIITFLYNYSIDNTQKQFGIRQLSKDQQLYIQDLIKEMQIERPIILRSMNWRALQQFGYCNAFALAPLIYNIFPVSNTYFLYLSEGFFEHLSPQEQRFLIGHELAHIKHDHLRFMSLVGWLVFLALMGCGWFLYRKLKLFNLHKIYRYVIVFIIGSFCFIILVWGEIIYRKHIEREADLTSLQMLHSYQGFLTLIDRWTKEYHIPICYGFFATHPSINERKEYCLSLQAEQKQQGLS